LDERGVLGGGPLIEAPPQRLREPGGLTERAASAWGAIDALVDELIESNPCMLHRGELPAKIDKDPGWRTSATFTTREVEQLISDLRIPSSAGCSTRSRRSPGCGIARSLGCAGATTTRRWGRSGAW
jgi:hypothetical protein